MRKRVASGVLMQTLGPHQRPVAFYSLQLDLVEAGAPTYISSMSVAATIEEKTQSSVFGRPITIYEPHEVELLHYKHYKTSPVSPA